MKIITGMHRSGTSMVSNLIMEIAGHSSHRDLVEADRWNENGYFENKEFVILNNSILVGEFSVSSMFLRYPPEKRNQLIRLAMSVSNLNYSLLMLNPGIIRRRARSRQAEMGFLAERFNDSIIKDPRFTLLMKEWRETGNVERVLFCFRNPLEVARSLRKRNLIPLALGCRLWKFHTEQFLDAMGDLPVAYVNHDNFFKPDCRIEEIRRLYWFLGSAFDEREAREIADRVIDNRLRHYSFYGNNLPKTVASLNRLLIELHEQGPPL